MRASIIGCLMLADQSAVRIQSQTFLPLWQAGKESESRRQEIPRFSSAEIQTCLEPELLFYLCLNTYLFLHFFIFKIFFFFVI